MNSLILQTKRLLLTPFQASDLQFFHEMNIHPFVRKYLWDDEIISIDTAVEMMKTNEKHFQEDKFGLWKISINQSESIIGYTGLWFFFDEPQPQLIYALQKDSTGKGYAIEAARAVLNYTFTELGFKYLLAAID